MTLKPTILNIATVIFLAGCIGYTLINYRRLSYEEGWGIVAMVGLVFFGLFFLAVDVLIQRLIGNKRLVNIVGVVIVMAACLLLLKWK